MPPSHAPAPTELDTPSLWSGIAPDPAPPGTPARPSSTRKRPRAFVLRCPSDPTHGPLIETTAGRLYCPHQSHDGRHGTAPTAAYYSLDAAEAAARQHEED